MAERSYGAVGRLLLEIQNVFGLEISRSGLQGLIRVLKGGADAGPSSSLPEEDPPSSPPNPEAGAGLQAQELAEAPQEIRESGVKSLEETHADKAPDSASQPSVEAGTPSGNNAHLSPFFPKDPSESLYWCDHAGALILRLGASSPPAAAANCIKHAGNYLPGRRQEALRHILGKFGAGPGSLGQIAFNQNPEGPGNSTSLRGRSREPCINRQACSSAPSARKKPKFC